MSTETSAVLASLGEVIGTATDWYLAFHPANNAHAGISLKQEDHRTYRVVVTHADNQHQLLATARSDGLGGWATKFHNLHNPEWFVVADRIQGFGAHRYTYAEAEQIFREYAKQHHVQEKVTFLKSAPGRTVVRRSVIVDDRTLGAVPFGVILDERVIKGERIFAQDTLENPTYGIDIYG